MKEPLASQAIAADLAKLLLGKQWSISLAESCTGGSVASALTDISGCSQWFNYGIVTYSNEAKNRLLQVPQELLQQHGAVSKAVAEAMVVGVQKLANSDVAIAITGIAGPAGGSPDKPVGTVWFAWNIAGLVLSERCQFDGGRREVREQAVFYAISGAISAIESTV